MARLLVVGGSGFIGRAVCRLAVAAGHDVESVSRSGRPDITDRWAESVTWIGADLFSPDRWRGRLRDRDSVVHSVGTLHESPDGGSFERINGDAAILTALESERAGVEGFTFVSSSENPPTVRDAYLTAKRRAERAIRDLDLRTTVVRAGPVYGPDQPHFSPLLNAGLAAIDRIEPVAGRLGDGRPLPRLAVARAILAAADPEIDTPATIGVDAIDGLR